MRSPPTLPPPQNLKRAPGVGESWVVGVSVVDPFEFCSTYFWDTLYKKFFEIKLR